MAASGEYMRFWYCFIYLFVALANIVAVNIYFAVVKKLWDLAKVWSGTVTFPTIMVSMFFVSNYGYTSGASFPLLFLQIGPVVSAIVMGISIWIFLSPDILRNFRKERR